MRRFASMRGWASAVVQRHAIQRVALSSATALTTCHLASNDYSFFSRLFPSRLISPRLTEFDAPSASSSSSSPVAHAHPVGFGKPSESGSRRRSEFESIPSADQASVVYVLEGGQVGQAGEDSWLRSSDDCFFAVSDGVGGWRGTPGADSAKFSRTLMMNALRVWNTASVGERASPLAILEKAYAATLESQRVEKYKGSATVCMMVYDPIASRISYLNLGDSGLLLVRSPSSPDQQPFRAKQSQHRFNAPFQLGTNSRDLPKHGNQGSCDVSKGDMIVLGTDGLFDNQFESDLVKVVQEAQRRASINGLLPPDQLRALAEELALSTYAFASDSKRDSPFSLQSKAHGLSFRGGKMDDISLMLVQITGAKPTPSVLKSKL